MTVSSFAKKAGAPPFPGNYKQAQKRLAEAWRIAPEKYELLKSNPDLYWALVHFATWRNMGAE